MDNIAGLGRELTTDEKIAALQKEVQAQVGRRTKECFGITIVLYLP